MAGILLDDPQSTDEQRSDLARALAALKRSEAVARLAAIKARDGGARLAAALAVPGVVVHDEVLEPGPWTRKIPAGHHLRIVDLEGQQAVDFLCYDLHDTQNRYNAANTIKGARSVYLGAGVRLYSDRGDVLMTIEEDSVGHHDTIAGACSTEFNHRRYGIQGTPSCRCNFIAALARHGLSARDIPANINFFMNVPVRADGSTEIEEGLSTPGDFVDLRAERDTLVVISNCPQRFNPCSGWNPTPVRLLEWQP
ncbi:MAG TPA: DUF1989 domain-containing protein [Burkholderiaceae bacterium]